MWLRRLTSGFSSEKCTSTPLPASLTLNRRNPGDFPGFQCPDNSGGAFAVDSRFVLAPIPSASNAPRSAGREVPPEGKITTSSPLAALGMGTGTGRGATSTRGASPGHHSSTPKAEPSPPASSCPQPHFRAPTAAPQRCGPEAGDFQRDEPGLDLSKILGLHPVLLSALLVLPPPFFFFKSVWNCLSCVQLY